MISIADTKYAVLSIKTTFAIQFNELDLRAIRRLIVPDLVIPAYIECAIAVNRMSYQLLIKISLKLFADRWINDAANKVLSIDSSVFNL